MDNKRIEEICSKLCVGPSEVLEFVSEARREKIAVHLGSLTENKGIDELTKWCQALQDYISDNTRHTPVVESPRLNVEVVNRGKKRR